MVRSLRQLRSLAALLLGAASVAASAAPADRLALLDGLCAGAPGQPAAIGGILVAGASQGVADPAGDRDWARRVIDAGRKGALICRENEAAAINDGDTALDGVSLQPLGAPATGAALVPTIVARRLLSAAGAQLDLFSTDLATRRAAAAQVDKAFALMDPAVVEHALAASVDQDVRLALTLALAKRGLGSDDAAERMRAIDTVAASPSETSRTLLRNFLAERKATLDAGTLASTQAALARIERWLLAGHVCSVVFSGLSYAGVLLITALGLSIVFGLLGVINLAHGEFIMLGAYTTYLVEQALRTWMPGLFDAYLLLAVPAAFAVAALGGVVLEFCVIRFLYRRPLETLLATWAVSLAMVKGVQLAFGAQNVEFISPSWLAGGVQVFAGFFVTWNRVFAIVLALAVFAATYLLIRRTRLGLLIRATTQRRDTARSLGVDAENVDRLSFALGTGLAGVAGVVLTQISSVNPSMGTSFVVDAFMVVVFGGAGSLVGTASSSLVLGEINQFIEPLYGAVAAKVLVLVLVVLVIQRRPQGLFALRTRT